MHSFLNVNMIRYEIQEFLLSNLNYVNYEQRYLIRGKSCSAGHYNAHSLRKQNICNQLQHHTRFSIRGVCDESRLRARSDEKERVRLTTPAFVLVSLSHTISYFELCTIINIGQRRMRAIGLHLTQLFWMTRLGSMDHTFGRFCKSQMFIKNAMCGIDSTFTYGFIMINVCTLISYHIRS